MKNPVKHEGPNAETLILRERGWDIPDYDSYTIKGGAWMFRRHFSALVNTDIIVQVYRSGRSPKKEAGVTRVEAKPYDEFTLKMAGFRITRTKK